jgi:ribosomal protein S18 acetylase RimI-like enzyme
LNSDAKIHFREIRISDLSFMEEMLFIALWDPPEKPRRPRAVLADPRIRKYVDDWGQPGDVGFIAEIEGVRAGAVWCRNVPCLTEEFADLPELGIGLCEDFQNTGLGTSLMRQLLIAARAEHPGIRLGVHPENARAIRLYENFGFQVYAQQTGQYPQMVLVFETA